MSAIRATAGRLLDLFDQWVSEEQVDVLACYPCCADGFAAQVWLALHGRHVAAREALRERGYMDGTTGRIPINSCFTEQADGELLLTVLGEIPLGRLLHGYPPSYLKLCLRYALDGVSPEGRLAPSSRLLKAWGIDRATLAQLAPLSGPLRLEGTTQ